MYSTGTKTFNIVQCLLSPTSTKGPILGCPLPGILEGGQANTQLPILAQCSLLF